MSDKITEAFAAADSAELKRIACRARVESINVEVAALLKQVESKRAEADRFSSEEKRHEESLEAAYVRLEAAGIDRASAAKMVDMRVKMLAGKVEVALDPVERPAPSKKKTKVHAARAPEGTETSSASETEKPAHEEPTVEEAHSESTVHARPVEPVTAPEFLADGPAKKTDNNPKGGPVVDLPNLT